MGQGRLCSGLLDQDKWLNTMEARGTPFTFLYLFKMTSMLNVNMQRASPDLIQVSYCEAIRDYVARHYPDEQTEALDRMLDRLLYMRASRAGGTA
jgi:hypothetical protein